MSHPNPLLSININKVATLRNTRPGNTPCLLECATRLIELGARGITVHPRPDERHIRYQDIPQLLGLIKPHSQVEFNIEGYPSDKFLSLIEAYPPHQCTLVPDPPEALTSNAGWRLARNALLLEQSLQRLHRAKVRSSLFVDPANFSPSELNALKELRPSRIELYTEAFAAAFAQQSAELEHVVAAYVGTARKAHAMHIEVNAGHGLNTQNLGYFLKHVPHIKEVSIGHAFVCESFALGMETGFKNLKQITARAYAPCQTAH